MFKELIKRKKEKGLLGIELLAIVYSVITGILILIIGSQMQEYKEMLLTRLFTIIGIFVLNVAYMFHPCKLGIFIRMAPILLMLIMWYPETYNFCREFPNLDHVFAQMDQQLFGCQPALEFSKVLPSKIWSEMFCFGYYSYYYMMIGTMLFCFLCRYHYFEKASFIFLCSFFLYYLIFEFVPVAGPQYYFHAVGTSSFSDFPSLGYYFQNHLEAIQIDHSGLFSQLVASAQEAGERPTAAFPSSHVGMSTVTMILAWNTRNKYLFYIMLPVYILLCCATVYIKAHYLVDVIAGLISALIFYYASKWLYEWITGKESKLSPLLHQAR